MKTKVRKYAVSVNQVQEEALKKMMKEDMQDNVSSYFGLMIAELSRRREGDRARRPVGRPRKPSDGSDGSREDEDQEVKWYPCPYDENAPPYTMDDLEAYYTFRNMPVPPQPPPYSKEQLKRWDM